MVESNEKSSGEMTFFEHISSLRPHIVRSAVVFMVLAVVMFLLKDIVVSQIIMGPKSPDFPLNSWLCQLGTKMGIPDLCINQLNFTMINTSMAGQFNLHIKISVIAALILSVPYIMWELWRFVKPALTRQEIKGCRFFVFNISICFFSGVAFGYFIISPLAVNFLSSYVVSQSITNMIDVNSYLSTIMNIVIACGVVFQLPLLVYLLARIGILSPEFMKKYRRHAIIILSVLAALITPPDVFSMVLVLLPLYGLYELSISICARVTANRAIKRSDLS